MNKPASKSRQQPKPVPKPLQGPPVVPRDAASLMLLRLSGGKVEVLMGQRHTRSPFMPDIYVFPGGKIESDDWLMQPASNLDPAVSLALQATAKCSGAKATALANAAIRETWEEVGLMLATKTPAPGGSGVWSDFTNAGLAPNLGGLRMIGRAITPTNSPQRFHARFLAAEADLTVGELRESDELADLGFRTIEEALDLPVIDVTEEMLKHVADLSREGLGFLKQPQQKIVFASYRNQRPQVRLV
jgi:8-oxo-dGTP pyrophosphatase MutT (NUDIX family)